MALKLDGKFSPVSSIFIVNSYTTKFPSFKKIFFEKKNRRPGMGSDLK